jgi:hypothetical protein
MEHVLPLMYARCWSSIASMVEGYSAVTVASHMKCDVYPWPIFSTCRGHKMVASIISMRNGTQSEMEQVERLLKHGVEGLLPVPLLAAVPVVATGLPGRWRGWSPQETHPCWQSTCQHRLGSGRHVWHCGVKGEVRPSERIQGSTVQDLNPLALRSHKH